MDSDHNILIAEFDTSEIIPNNWSHTQQTPEETINKRLIFHFTDTTTEYWDSFRMIIDENSEHRALPTHLDTLNDSVSKYGHLPTRYTTIN